MKQKHTTIRVTKEAADALRQFCRDRRLVITFAASDILLAYVKTFPKGTLKEVE